MTRKARSVAVILALGLSPLSACSRGESAPPAPAAQAQAEASPASVGQAPAAASASPLSANASPTARKIIRQAELELEVAAPGTTQTSIEHLAERHGGYVVSASRDTDRSSSIDERVNVTLRVPQAELTSTIAEVKRLGRGTGSEKITSDDVTDEYVDLNARIVSQKQLEQQYFEILKRAVTVKDAMEVQKELAEVRTEIERMQGRQQLLEKESAFSTLTVHLTTAVPRVAVSKDTFGDTLRRAWSSSLSFSADLLIGMIQLLAWLIPVLLLVFAPAALGVYVLVRVARAWSRRAQRRLEAAT